MVLNGGVNMLYDGFGVVGWGRGGALWCCGMRGVLSLPQWTPEPVHRGCSRGGEGWWTKRGRRKRVEGVGGVGAPWPDQHKLNSLHSDFEAFN